MADLTEDFLPAYLIKHSPQWNGLHTPSQISVLLVIHQVTVQRGILAFLSGLDRLITACVVTQVSYSR